MPPLGWIAFSCVIGCLLLLLWVVIWPTCYQAELDCLTLSDELPAGCEKKGDPSRCNWMTAFVILSALAFLCTWVLAFARDELRWRARTTQRFMLLATLV